VELEELLNAFDRTAANVEKLAAVWDRASGFIPRDVARGSNPEYENLSRAWSDLLPGLPPIDGWTITEGLPDIDAMGQGFIDYREIGEPPFALYEEGERPGRLLDEYRYRLARARRRAVRDRLDTLTRTIDACLATVLQEVNVESHENVDHPCVVDVSAAFQEIDRLVGDSAERRGRWGDFRRHLRFNEGVDWRDIANLDWPSVRADIDAITLAESDPLPVPAIDLGEAASGELVGVATLSLPWEVLDDDGFERLLFDLLRSYSEHENVQWLMQTRAPDRGRDLSMERVLKDGTGGVRRERVIVQAKHWRSRSVSGPEIAATVSQCAHWQPPVVRGLIIATSGRFSADAVDWTEKHNESGVLPLVDLWPESKLESLLAERPHLAAAHGLR
jgi:hypothetical protein